MESVFRFEGKIMLKRIVTNNWTLGFLFGLGILIAGSDGLWFPWINLAGVFLIGCVGLVAVWLCPAP